MKSSSATVSIDHLNFTVRKFAESADWYRDVFGFEIVEEGMERDGPWGILRSGETMLCIYESQRKTEADWESLHHIYHFGLRVRDRAQWENTVRENNIRVYYGGPVRYPHSTSWYIKDPTGHMIEVTHWNGNEVTFGSRS